MHTLRITLHSANGWRLTKYAQAAYRNTATENELRASVESEVNNDNDHKAHAPWKVGSSGWES